MLPSSLTSLDPAIDYDVMLIQLDPPLKGYAGCHVTCLHIMTLGPLGRVMMVKPPFHAQNVENSCFLCAKFSPGQPGQQFHCPGRHSNPVYPPVD